MSQQYSLKMTKTKIVGRAYFKKNFTSIFIAKMTKFAMEENMDNIEEAYEDFLFNLINTELHEHLHLFFYHIKQHPWSERQIKDWVKRASPFIQELLMEIYKSLFYEVFVWMKEKSVIK